MSLANFLNNNTDPPWISGFILATLSDIVYEVDSTYRQQRYSLLGFEELNTIFQRLLNIGDIEASILRSENVVVVVFRGSEDLDEPLNIIDWLTNANMSTIPFCGSTVIHKGFANLATLFLPEIRAQLQRLPDVDEIWLTGHSLGGAIAQAVGYCLHTLHSITVRRVVTFGSPRIGGALKWAAPARISGYKVDRWVNEGDPIPRVPSIGLHNPLDPRTHFPVLWRHYGRLNYIDWVNSRVRFDDDRVLGPLIDAEDLNFSDHRIVHYKHRLFDLMPSVYKDEIKNSFTEIINLRFLFERAEKESGEKTKIDNLQTIVAANSFSGEENSVKCLMLRYL